MGIETGSIEYKEGGHDILARRIEAARRAVRMLEDQRAAELAQYEQYRKDNPTFIGISPNTQDINSRIQRLTTEITNMEEELLKVG